VWGVSALMLDRASRMEMGDNPFYG
jgi:hypothetical protein